MHIYLDHNSTTPIAPEAAHAMAECYREGYVNPASQHRPGQRARQRLEELRERISSTLGGITAGMATDTLVFTSGGTESNNLAIGGIASSRSRSSVEFTAANRPVVLVSAIEHPSVIGAAAHLSAKGFDVQKIPVQSSGVIDVEAFAQLVENARSGIALVCLMLANNETGVIQPVARTADICREKGIPVHCDAVQAIAKIPVNFRELGVDTLTFTAHKFHGPRGIGGLLIRQGVTVDPILFGGFQQMAIRPGTEDLALVAGMSRALDLWTETGAATSARMESLRDQLQHTIVDAIDDVVVNGVVVNGVVVNGVVVNGVVINGGEASRVPHTLNISFPDIDRQAFLLAADLANLAISTGSACASGSSEPSHVISAMTSQSSVIEGSIRISLGAGTTAQEVEESGRRIVRIYNDLRSHK